MLELDLGRRAAHTSWNSTEVLYTGCDRVFEASAPSRPIERGLAEPGLLAHVTVSKPADHLPRYRQSGIYARQGAEIARSRLAGASSDLLTPLVDAIQKHVPGGRKLHAGDTLMPVLSPGNGKTKIQLSVVEKMGEQGDKFPALRRRGNN
jgi:hypothetical protein